MDKELIFDTPDQINGARLLTLRSGLKLELIGLKMTRGRSCYAIIKNEFGFKGSKQKVFDQFTNFLQDKGLLI